MMLEKWESVVNQVQNIHEHDGQLYTECPHGPLEGRERHKKWPKPGKLYMLLIYELLIYANFDVCKNV